MSVLRSILALSAVLACAATARAAFQACELAQLNEVGSQLNSFASALDLSNDLLVIGAPYAEPAGQPTNQNSGAIVCYRRSLAQWQLEAILHSPDAGQDCGHGFGQSISIGGAWMFVGASYEATTDCPAPGAAFAYERVGNAWVFRQKLPYPPGEPQIGRIFGSAVATDGQYGVVSNYRYASIVAAEGRAYVYERQGSAWVLSSTPPLAPTPAGAESHVGYSLAIDADRIAVGAPLYGGGAVFMYRRNAVSSIWELEQTVQAPLSVPVGRFGNSVALAAGDLVVGAPLSDDTTTWRGLAFAYSNAGGTWQHVQTLSASDADDGDEFGAFVDVDGDTIVASALAREPAPPSSLVDSGAAYVFGRSAGVWSEQTILTASDAVSSMSYGQSAKISGGFVAVGSSPPIGGIPHGRVYVYVVGGSDCNGNGVFDLCDIASGTSADTNASGIPDECEPAPTSFCAGDGSATACPCGNSGTADSGCANSVNATGAALTGSGVASIGSDTLLLAGSRMPDSSALYFQGTAQQNGGFGTTFGDGLRCVGGAIDRLGTKLNSAGASQYPDAGDSPISVQGMVISPGIRTYQVWYRNAASYCTPATFNLTNGWQVSWTM